MKRSAWLVLATAVLVSIGLTLRSPFPRAIRLAAESRPATAAERGRVVYERYGCAMCHGVRGEGGVANPNSETEGKIPGVVYVKEGYTTAELRSKVLDGMHVVGKADANGPVPPYRMPGWRGHMSEREVADLVEYLLSLYPASAEESWR